MFLFIRLQSQHPAAGSPVNMSPTEMWEEKRIWRGPRRSGPGVTAHGWPNTTVLYIIMLQGTYSVFVEAEPSGHEHWKRWSGSNFTAPLSQEGSQKILISGQAMLKLWVNHRTKATERPGTFCHQRWLVFFLITVQVSASILCQNLIWWWFPRCPGAPQNLFRMVALPIRRVHLLTLDGPRWPWSW